MSKKLNELESNNKKLKDLLLRCWITMSSMRNTVKSLESSLDYSYVKTLDADIETIEYDILSSGIITNDESK